ncbi:HNH endonuclease [Mycobacterium phage KashFlow]|nr:HNH endonuclease [Mycobacterium phage KashFlow]
MDATSNTEEWRPAPGYEGLYEVSSHGRVRSLDRTVPTRRHPGGVRKLRGCLLKPSPSKYGHLMVSPSKDGRQKVEYIHHLVMLAFSGPRPDGMLVCHNDGDPANNRLDNLRWDDQFGNMRDTLSHGTCFQANKTHCIRGHEFNQQNTHIAPDGGRVCRLCRRITKNARRARLRQQGLPIN